jgi:hypothetical protein
LVGSLSGKGTVARVKPPLATLITGDSVATLESGAVMVTRLLTTVAV